MHGTPSNRLQSRVQAKNKKLLSGSKLAIYVLFAICIVQAKNKKMLSGSKLAVYVFLQFA